MFLAKLRRLRASFGLFLVLADFWGLFLAKPRGSAVPKPSRLGVVRLSLGLFHLSTAGDNFFETFFYVKHFWLKIIKIKNLGGFYPDGGPCTLVPKLLQLHQKLVPKLPVKLLGFPAQLNKAQSNNVPFHRRPADPESGYCSQGIFFSLKTPFWSGLQQNLEPRLQ